VWYVRYQAAFAALPLAEQDSGVFSILRVALQGEGIRFLLRNTKVKNPNKPRFKRAASLWKAVARSLCDRVDSETSQHVSAAHFGVLKQGRAGGNESVELEDKDRTPYECSRRFQSTPHERSRGFNRTPSPSVVEVSRGSALLLSQCMVAGR